MALNIRYWFFILIGIRIGMVASKAQVVTYPLAPCFAESESRFVTVIQNNREYKVPVRKFMSHDSVFYDYAHFSFSGKITVKIKNPSANISNYEIVPLSYNMGGTVSGKELSFPLAAPRYVQVSVNQENNRPLFILADTLENNIPSASGKGIYNIASTPYNADNTGKTNVTSIIQNAINDAYNAGGGTVFIPTGVFKLSKIQAKSNVNIYLQGGAVLMELNAAESAQSTRIIEGNNISNVKIYGRGTIWCNGSAANNNRRTDTDGSTRIGGIKITNKASNIHIEGITISESTIWTIGFHDGTNKITVKNTKILNATDWNWNDGFDICGGYNALLNHCLYVGADDAACCKVYKGFPVYDVCFSDFVVKSEHASGFKAGMQAYDDLYNIKAENFRIINCKRGFNFDHWYGTGKWGGNTIVKNFWIDKATGNKRTTLGTCQYIDAPFRLVICNKDNTGVGAVSHILIENIYYSDGANLPYLMGNSDTANISNITFKNCLYNGTPVTDALSGNIRELEFVNNITYIYSEKKEHIKNDKR